jgi:hypothetical protein
MKLNLQSIAAATFLVLLFVIPPAQGGEASTKGSLRKTFSGLTAEREGAVVRLSFRTGGGASAKKDPITARIYRKTIENFTFGTDYAEYFHEMPFEGAEVVKEVTLTRDEGILFSCTDETVKIGKTYAYWVASPDDVLATGPAPVKVRDTAVWWPKTEIDARLKAIAEAFPEKTALKTYGYTAVGEPLYGMLIGNTKGGLALVGAIHAGESGPELILPAVERLLEEESGLLEKVGLALLPVVNADERERQARGCPWYLRKNATGVDLNRNFDAMWEVVDKTYGLSTDEPVSATYRGPRPGSAPETQAVIEFIEEAQPRLVLSYHALASITGASFLAPKAAKDAPLFQEWPRGVLEAYGKGMYPDGGREARISFGTSSGSFPTWLYLKKGIAGFDVEWDGNPETEACRRDEVTPGLLSLNQKQHYGGMVAALRVMAGEPEQP